MTSEKAEEVEESQRLEEAKRHYNLGYDAFDLELYEIAIDEYTTAIQLNPSYAKAYTNRGLAYRKLKRHDQAMADIKEAARLGSTVARDDLLSKNRTNKILLGTATAIVLLIIISAWQNHNEKVNREEMQRQQVIAAEQARIKAEQEQAAFQEEYMREYKKKMIHDMVYHDDMIDDVVIRRPSHSYNAAGRAFGRGTIDEPMTRRAKLPRTIEDDRMIQPSTISPSNDSMSRMEIESIAKRQAERAVENDRLLHGLPPFPIR